MSQCLYHKDKATFDKVQKELQSSKWIPRKYVHRLAMAICCCRKSKGNVVCGDELQKQIDFLRQFIRSDIEDGETSISPLLHSFIQSCTNYPTETDFSRCRLVTILYNAKHCDYSYLIREMSKNEAEELLVTKIPKPQKLTAVQIECIKRKRKKKMVSQVFKLDMFPGNSRKLETSLGQTLSDFSKENKCYIDFQTQMNNKSYEGNTNATYVKVWSKDTAALNSIKTVLTTTSRTVQKTMDEERKRRKKLKANFRSINYDIAADDDVDSGGHWSCCYDWSEVIVPVFTQDYDNHSETGCKTLAQHVWRPHAKASRDSQKKETYIDNQYARRRHIKHIYPKHKK